MVSNNKCGFMRDVERFGLNVIMLSGKYKIDPAWLDDLPLADVVATFFSLYKFQRNLIEKLVREMPLQGMYRIDIALLENLYTLAARDDVYQELCRRNVTSVEKCFDLIASHCEDYNSQKNQHLYHLAMEKVAVMPRKKAFQLMCQLNSHYHGVIQRFCGNEGENFYCNCLMRDRKSVV